MFRRSGFVGCKSHASGVAALLTGALASSKTKEALARIFLEKSCTGVLGSTSYWVNNNKTNTVTAGTVCNPELFQFPAVKKRAVQASFNGGDLSSDGGLVLLRQTDRRIGLTRALAKNSA